MRMRAGVLTDDCPSDCGQYTVWAGDAQRQKGGKNSVQSSLEDSSSAEQPAMKLEQLAERVQSRTPLRLLVRWVAGIRASVHTKARRVSDRHGAFCRHGAGESADH